MSASKNAGSRSFGRFEAQRIFPELGLAPGPAKDRQDLGRSVWNPQCDFVRLYFCVSLADEAPSPLEIGNGGVRGRPDRSLTVAGLARQAMELVVRRLRGFESWPRRWDCRLTGGSGWQPV